MEDDQIRQYGKRVQFDRQQQEQGTTVSSDLIDPCPPGLLMSPSDSIDTAAVRSRQRYFCCFYGRYHVFVQSIFYLLGIGILMPWNAFISATPYFNHRLAVSSTSNSSGSNYNDHNEDNNVPNVDGGTSFASVFAIVFNVSSVLTLGILLLAPNLACFNNDRKHSRHTQQLQEGEPENDAHIDPQSSPHDHSFALVVVPLTIYVLVFCGQAYMVLQVDMPRMAFLLCTVVGLMLCGACTVLAQSGIVATAAFLETKVGSADVAMNPYLQGQAIGGVAVSLANLMASSWEDPHIFANAYCPSNSFQYIKSHSTSFSSKTGVFNPSDNWSSFLINTISRVMLYVVPLQFDVNHDNDTAVSLSQEVNQATKPYYVASSFRFGDESTNQHETVDWGVFLYFIFGTFTLAVSLLGYQFVRSVDQKQLSELREYFKNNNSDYETIHSDDNLEILLGEDPLITTTTTARLPPSYCSSSTNSSTSTNGVELATTQITPRTPAESDMLNRHDYSSNLPHSVIILDGSSEYEIKGSRYSVEPDGIFHNSNDTNDNNQVINLAVGLTRKLNGNPSNDRFLIHNNPSSTFDGTTTFSTITVWNRVRGPTVAVYITLLVTLSLFPGYTSKLRSIHQCSVNSDNYVSSQYRLFNDLFIPFTFVIFNVGDLLGRLVPSFVPSRFIQKLSKNLVLCSVCRVIFIPLLFLCVTNAVTSENYHSGQKTVHDNLLLSGTDGAFRDLSQEQDFYRKFLIPSDTYTICILLLFGVSNGLLLSMAFVHAPSLLAELSSSQTTNNNNTTSINYNEMQYPPENSTNVNNTEDAQEKMSTMLNFAVSFGLLSGSLLSYPVSSLALFKP